MCEEEGEDAGKGFGKNVVFEPPPIPAFEGHYRPDATRAQRLRFRFSKRGDMVFVGHLDLMKTFDRACRRAALPVSGASRGSLRSRRRWCAGSIAPLRAPRASFGHCSSLVRHPSRRPRPPPPGPAADESPFAVRQRIYAALPLPLGATSDSEWLELVLTQRFEPEDVRARLQAQLPGGLELLGVEEAAVKKIDGSNGEKMAQQLDSVEYHLVVQQAQQAQQAQQEADNSAASSGGADAGTAALAAAVARALAAPSFEVERRSKARGRVKVSRVDLRWALQEMEAVPRSAAAAAGVPAEVLPPGSAVVRLRTACAKGNPVLTPAMVLDMLNGTSSSSSVGGSSGAAELDSSAGLEGAGHSGSGGAWALSHIHRSDLRLRPMSVPQPDALKLRSLCRMEGHLAAAKAAGRGPWACGIEDRPDVD